MGNLTFANEVGLRIEDPSILMMPGTWNLRHKWSLCELVLWIWH
jgi:hypothetical protein